jgi:ADP-ribose pyrophosphatase YjhB (NUDIX family)
MALQCAAHDPERRMNDDPRLSIRHCPDCGAAAFELRVPRRDDRERPVCTRCGYVHYVGPVLAAGAILHDGERLCLVRRAHEPGCGKWTFPGGFVDLDEEPDAAAVRETREETGYHAEIERLQGAYRSEGPRGKRVVIAVYVARLTGEAGGSSEEVKEVRWFAPDALPPDDEFAFPSTVRALREYLAR